MNLQIIKRKVSKMLHKKVVVKVYLGRNKYERHIGTINNIYPYLFTIKTNKEIKSFTYVDILTNEISIKEL